jgi:two-component system, NtrC family, sensor kinase
MYRAFLFLMMLPWLFATAQTPEADSLESVLQREKPGTELYFDLLIQLARASAITSPQKALEYGKEALATGEKLQNKKMVADAAKILGTNYYRQSDLANALEYFKTALRANLEINNIDELAPAYNNLGVVYNRLGYYDLALQNHLNQLKINESSNNKRGMAISYLNIGNIYNNLKETGDALEYYLKSREIYKKLNDTNSYANTSINLGVISMEMKKYSQAVDFFNEALLIKERLGDMNNIANIYTNLGVISGLNENFDDATSYLEKSMEIYTTLNNRQGVITSAINLGDVKMRLGRFEESYAHLLHALDLARGIDAKKLIQDASEKLSRWYAEQGDYAQSLSYFKTAATLKDSLLSSEKSMQIKNLQIVYEVEQKEKEILEQRIAIEKLKTGRVYFWLAIIVVFMLGIVIYSRYRIKQRLNRVLESKIAEALRKQNEQQQVIVHQSSLTSLGELASGIAHEIKQPLQNISLATESLQLENKETQPDKAFIDKTISEIQEDIKRIKLIISEISKFSRGQQMQIEEDFDPNQSIEKAFLLARTKISDLRIKTDFKLEKNIPAIRGNPYKFEQVLVNFINNAKDAIEERAASVTGDFEKRMEIKSRFNDDYIEVEVTDNGAGIPEEIKTNIFLPFFTTKSLGKGTGLGLSISLGIAKEMGGFIEVDSEKMIGTTMRLKIPRNS